MSARAGALLLACAVGVGCEGAGGSGEGGRVAVSVSPSPGCFALGATRAEVSVQVVLPAAMSGVTASFVLAVSRAIGETMAVTLAAGATPRLLGGVQRLEAALQDLAIHAVTAVVDPQRHPLRSRLDLDP